MKKQIKFRDKKDKPREKVSIINRILTNIIMFFMKDTIKRLDGMIDPEQQKAVEASTKELEDEVEKYNKMLEKPEIKKAIEDAGKSIEDFKMD